MNEKRLYKHSIPCLMQWTVNGCEDCEMKHERCATRENYDLRDEKELEKYKNKSEDWEKLCKEQAIELDGIRLWGVIKAMEMIPSVDEYVHAKDKELDKYHSLVKELVVGYEKLANWIGSYGFRISDEARIILDRIKSETGGKEWGFKI